MAGDPPLLDNQAGLAPANQQGMRTSQLHHKHGDPMRLNCNVQQEAQTLQIQ